MADVLCAAAEWIVVAEAIAPEEGGRVASTGELGIESDANNVIPARATLSLGLRHGEHVHERAVERERAAVTPGQRGVAQRWRARVVVTCCSPEPTGPLAEAVAPACRRLVGLPGGAGEHAAAFSTITPVAMLFVRCAGGVSHNPAEEVSCEDVAEAVEATTRFLERLA